MQFMQAAINFHNRVVSVGARPGTLPLLYTGALSSVGLLRSDASTLVSGTSIFSPIYYF